MFSFQYTEYLIGIIIIIPLLILFANTVYWKQKVKKALGDKTLINQLTANYSSNRYRLKFLLLCVSVTAIVIAAANLRRPSKTNEGDKIGVDIMFALDISNSMWAEDAKPSRLDLAKNVLSLFIDKLNENRMGLVVFAGKPFLQTPLTNDAGILKMCLSNASPDAVPVQGTVIADALKLCNNSLDDKTKKFKTIILISDGEDHDEHIDDILQQLSDAGVVVNTVGIGSLQGTTITEPGTSTFKTDINGQTVISKLNEQELKLIAEKTGGSYTHIESSPEEAAKKLYAQVDGMEKKLLKGGGGIKTYSSFFPFFTALALACLMIEIFIPEIKRVKK